MNREIVVGIDIGTTKIAVFIGQRDETRPDKAVILGVGSTESIGVERGVVKNIEQTSNSIKKAVEEVENITGYNVKEVFVGIAGHQIQNTPNKGQKVFERGHIIEEEDLKTLIEEQKNLVLGDPTHKIIDVVPQSYLVDSEPVSHPVGVPGAFLECNFNVISGNISNIENINRSVEKAGYKVRGLVLEPVASAEAVIDETEKEAGVCLVDIGGGTTDLAIFHDGILRHTSVMPLAGNVITEDIKEGCSIIRTQAESLKCNFGSCLKASANESEIIAIPGFRGREPREISMTTLAGIIQARMEMILEQVLFEIKTSGYERKLIAGIVLSGGGSKMKDLVQLSEYITGIDSRVGIPDDHIVGDFPDIIRDPKHSTGVGLVLEGLKTLESESNGLGSPMAVLAVEEEIIEEEPEEEIFEEEEEEVENEERTKNKRRGVLNMVEGMLKNLFKDGEID